MWINRKTYDDLRMERLKASTEADVLNRQNTAMQTTLDWFRVRVNQLEQERAQMLFNYTGVKMPVPTIQRTEELQAAATVVQGNPFADVGDEMAKKLGIDWNPDGTVSHGSHV